MKSVFENLDEGTKKIINMYTTARQFKNAINEEEILVMKKGVFTNKIYPYIVNVSFACEIYLKIIILLNGENYGKIHNLKDLYVMSKVCSEFETYVIENTKNLDIKYDKEKLDNDLNLISNAFVEWRYIFESEDLCIPNGFLNIFCNYLDAVCIKRILEITGINMNKYRFI